MSLADKDALFIIELANLTNKNPRTKKTVGWFSMVNKGGCVIEWTHNGNEASYEFLFFNIFPIL